MKILLIGEFSNIHWTLAEGLRQLGHQVCVVSDGNHWKGYKRDIDLFRPTSSKVDAVKYIVRLLRILPRLRGYDVVQIVNPSFLSLKPERSLPIYHYLRRHNKKIFLGAFGTDHYYAKACMESDVYKYSDFRTGHQFRDTPTNRKAVQECLYGGTALATQVIAQSCNGIIACLWEYYVAYLPHFSAKLTYIPLPINFSNITSRVRSIPDKVNLFIGIQSQRHDIKGTDIMLPVVRRVHQKHPDKCRLTEVVDMPYTQYQQLLDEADVQLDQLYAYTPSMNSLLAMAKGVVVCGGGEPENYELINERELRPIVNITPAADELFEVLEELVLHKERIPELSAQGVEYVKRHHDYLNLAQQYVDFWESH